MNGEDTVKMIRLMAQDDYLGIIGFMAEELAKQDLIKEKDKKDEEDNLLIKAFSSIKELQFEDSFEDTLFFQAGGANLGGILVCEDENVNKKQLLIDLEKRYPSDKDSYLKKVDGGFNGVDF